MASIIKQVQQDVEKAISVVAPAGVTVLSRLRGNISNDILATIAKKQIAVLVFPPSIGGVKPNVASCVQCDDCILQIRIIENPTLNASSTDAYELVEMLLSLNQFRTSGGQTLVLKSVEDASPDNAKVVEFVIELSFRATFERIKI